MKAALYSPYLDTLGGGEKYMMTIAEVLSSAGEVDVFLDSHLNSIGGDYLKQNLQNRFNINLSKVNFISGPIGSGSNFFERLTSTKKYDLLFYLTDGSIFIPFARKNILHIQSPIIGQPAKGFWGKYKLKGWELIIYNSNFTKQNAEKNWPLKSQVIYPPVEVSKIKELKKKKFILSVGRFFGHLKDKKHSLLIDVFNQLYKNGNLKGWSLHLVGSASEGDKTYIDQLKKQAEKLPINFYPNLGYDELIKLYGHSSIYWHASGFGESDPTKMEHFGISTVEAMTGGCVPVVINLGGQTEIVENKKCGFLWDSLEELKSYTLELVNDNSLWKEFSKEARLRAGKFSKEEFSKKILALIKN